MTNFVPRITLKCSLIVYEDKIKHRRKRVAHLYQHGYSNWKIAEKLGYCLSTIEKDLHTIRENFRGEVCPKITK